MSHTLTQPEEVELVWKEPEPGNITCGLRENKTERAREGLGDSASAARVASKPVQGGTVPRC